MDSGGALIVDWHQHYKAVEVSKMRQLMQYDQSDYESDWNVMIALAVLQTDGEKDHLQRMMDSCWQRILAYLSNNPDARPWSNHDPYATSDPLDPRIAP